MRQAVAEHVPDGASVALGLQMEQMIPFAAGHEIIRQKKKELRLIGPISDILFDPKETLLAVRALVPDVAIVHLQRADKHGNAHCWGNFGVMLEGVRAAKKVIVCAEEIVGEDVIASDPNRTVIPGFLVTAVVECPMGAHPSPVQGYYKRDDAFFQQYHADTKTSADFAAWAQRWVHDVSDRAKYAQQLGEKRVEELGVKQHAYAARTDFGY